MKKFKTYGFIFGFLFVLVGFLPILSACTAFSDYRKLEIEYTENLEFLVGEDYEDSNLKGYAIRSNAAKEDVTKKMTIDSSSYKKNVAGTYVITCKFEEFEASYSVKVVNQITNLTMINERLDKVINNSFKCDSSGKLNYEATNSSNYQGYQFDECLTYSENNGVISAYLTWTFRNNIVKEFWFNGRANSGTIKNRVSGGSLQQFTNATIDDFNIKLEQEAGNYPISVSVYSSEYNFELTDCDATLTKDSNNNYVVNVEMDGFQFDIVYKNNIIKEWIGVTYTFDGNLDLDEPEAPESERIEINKNDAFGMYQNATSRIENESVISLEMTTNMDLLMSGSVLAIKTQEVEYSKTNMTMFGILTKEEVWTIQEDGNTVNYKVNTSDGAPVYTKEIVNSEDDDEDSIYDDTTNELEVGNIKESYNLNGEVIIVFEDGEDENKTVTTVTIKNDKIFSIITILNDQEVQRQIFKYGNETPTIPSMPNPVSGWEDVVPEEDDDSDDNNETVANNIELSFISIDADLEVKIYTRTNNSQDWQICSTRTVRATDWVTIFSIVLLDEDYNFGNMQNGDFVEIKFEFVNTGSANLSLEICHDSWNSFEIIETYKIDDGNYAEFPSFFETVETNVGESQTRTVYLKLDCDGYMGGCRGGYSWTIAKGD